MTNRATNARPIAAPTRPALRAEVARCAGAGRAVRGSATTLATTGGTERRVRFGSGVPLPDESNEAIGPVGEGAVVGEAAGAEDAMGEREEKANIRRRFGGADGAWSGFDRAVPRAADAPSRFDLAMAEAADEGPVAAASWSNPDGRLPSTVDGGGLDGAAFPEDGDSLASVVAIFRSTSRRAGLGGRSESCVDMCFPVCEQRAPYLSAKGSFCTILS
jgi:hypothetical protein